MTNYSQSTQKVHNRSMYSLDYRKRVLGVKEEEDLTYAETSKRFRVSMRTLFNWEKRLEPKKKWERKSRKIDLERLERDVKEHPDKYQYERAKEFGVSAWGIGKALRKLGISYKKNSPSSKSRRSGTYQVPD